MYEKTKTSFATSRRKVVFYFLVQTNPLTVGKHIRVSIVPVTFSYWKSPFETYRAQNVCILHVRLIIVYTRRHVITRWWDYLVVSTIKGKDVSILPDSNIIYTYDRISYFTEKNIIKNHKTHLAGPNVSRSSRQHCAVPVIFTLFVDIA